MARFLPGQSGNPGGQPKGARARREAVASKLDAVFLTTRPDGIVVDALVAAIARGVAIGDGVCIRLAAEYRWGKPTERHEIAADEDVPGIVVEFIGPGAGG